MLKAPLVPLLAVLLALAAPRAAAPDDALHAEGDSSPPHHSHPSHRSHSGVTADPSYRRSLAAYAVPDVTLVSAAGDEIALRAALANADVVALNFVFTSCRSICPVMSATFAALEHELGPDRAGLTRVSISIDPEHDDPARLRAYARRLGADAGWLFLTGELSAIARVQRAFDADRGSKASHLPVTFLHGPSQEGWVRIEGFASAAELAHEIRRLVSE